MKQYSGEEWQPPQIVELRPDIGEIALTTGMQIQTSLRPKLEGDSGRLIWLTDETPLDDFKTLEGVTFENVPSWKEGREASLQGVFFGRIGLSDSVETPVAVKPFLSDFNSGAHEAAMLLDLEGKGLRVYRVLGMAWTPEQGYAMITGFEEESKSLDNVDWSKALDEPLGSHLTNLEALEQVGQSLGIMHANGIVHCDAQVKNFAVNGKEVVLIDLASARSMIGEYGLIDEAVLRDGMQKDMYKFIASLQGKGFLKDASPEEWSSFFTNVIAPAYRSGLFLANNEDNPNKINLQNTVQEMVDSIQALLEEGKPFELTFR